MHSSKDTADQLVDQLSIMHCFSKLRWLPRDLPRTKAARAPATLVLMSVVRDLANPCNSAHMHSQDVAVKVVLLSTGALHVRLLGTTTQLKSLLRILCWRRCLLVS